MKAKTRARGEGAVIIGRPCYRAFTTPGSLINYPQHTKRRMGFERTRNKIQFLHMVSPALFRYLIPLIKNPSTRALQEVVSRLSGVGNTTAESTVIADRGGVSTGVITEWDHVLIYDAIRTRAASAIGAATRKDGVLVISRSAAHEREALIVLVLMRIAGKEYIRYHKTWRDRQHTRHRTQILPCR